MNFEKKQVALSAIRPSGTNPRDDFGNIDALADAIRATGNEPVNPPVVVADGNVYRIVDGERRYRALKQIWKSNTNHEVTVLVADGMDDAAELVAMLATDDKKPLTDVERGHGVQQMLILGVDEERVARATRATREQMAAARAAALIVPAGAQVTLDQMVAAMGFESPEDREAVLSAGEAWRYEANVIKGRLMDEQHAREARELLESSGIRIVGKEASEDMEPAAALYETDSLKIMRDKVQGLPAPAAECAAILSGSIYRIYVPKGTASRLDPEEEERRREKEARLDLAVRMISYVLTLEEVPTIPELVEETVAARNPMVIWAIENSIEATKAGLMDSLREFADRYPASGYECAMQLVSDAERVAMGWQSAYIDSKETAKRGRQLLEAIDLYGLIGFKPLERDAWVIERARAAADGGDE